MTRLAKLRSLSAGELALLIRAILLIWGLRVALFVIPFRLIRRGVERLTRRRSPQRPGSVPTLDRGSWLLQAEARTLPSRRPCLSVALASRVLLERLGYATTLRIGVAKNDVTGKLDAHAWLESEGRIVVGDIGLDRFSVLEQSIVG